ncbi:hypothetical protein SUGI_0912460 [Cryptomeria japonica]|nr:hypothetical protein SUGI_0912460 [Cryptomeria japonica]
MVREGERNVRVFENHSKSNARLCAGNSQSPVRFNAARRVLCCGVTEPAKVYFYRFYETHRLYECRVQGSHSMRIWELGAKTRILCQIMLNDNVASSPRRKHFQSNRHLMIEVEQFQGP